MLIDMFIGSGELNTTHLLISLTSWMLTLLPEIRRITTNHSFYFKEIRTR